MSPRELLNLFIVAGIKESLFLVLWLEVGEKPDTLEGKTIAQIVEIAARRGLAITESKARKQLKALEEARLIEKRLVDRRAATYDFFIYRGAPERPEKTERERETSTPLFDAFPRSVLDAPTTDETAAVSAVAAATDAPKTGEIADAGTSASSKENLLINKKIKLGFEVSKVANEPEPKEPSETRSTDDVRTLVDFDAAKVAAFRRAVVRDVWEPTINPDLIDRLVAVAVLRVGGKTTADVRAIIAEAKERRRAFETTGRGEPELWKTLTFRVKRVFECAGWKWTPTRIADEPKPERRQLDVEPRRAAPVAAPASEPTKTVDQLRAAADGFDVDELDRPFEATVREIVRRDRNGFIPAQQKAFGVRGALRELKKRTARELEAVR